MLLSEMLHPGVIRTDLAASNRDAAIRELVGVLAEAHEIPLSMQEHALHAVLEREAEHGTGMEHGIAIPHAMSDRVEDPVAAVAVLKEGIDWRTIDGLPARIIILLVVPRKHSTGHVRTMAGIAHLMENADLRKAILAGDSPEAIMTIIEDAEDAAVFGER